MRAHSGTKSEKKSSTSVRKEEGPQHNLSPQPTLHIHEFQVGAPRFKLRAECLALAWVPSKLFSISSINSTYVYNLASRAQTVSRAPLSKHVVGSYNLHQRSRPQRNHRGLHGSSGIVVLTFGERHFLVSPWTMVTHERYALTILHI